MAHSSMMGARSCEDGSWAVQRTAWRRARRRGGVCAVWATSWSGAPLPDRPDRLPPWHDGLDGGNASLSAPTQGN